jgi:hypothetical protein
MELIVTLPVDIVLTRIVEANRVAVLKYAEGEIPTIEF